VIFGRGIKVSLLFSIVFFASCLLNLEVDDERTDDGEIREDGERVMEEGMWHCGRFERRRLIIFYNTLGHASLFHSSWYSEHLTTLLHNLDLQMLRHLI